MRTINEEAFKSDHRRWLRIVSIKLQCATSFSDRAKLSGVSASINNLDKALSISNSGSSEHLLKSTITELIAELNEIAPGYKEVIPSVEENSLPKNEENQTKEQNDNEVIQLSLKKSEIKTIINGLKEALFRSDRKWELRSDTSWGYTYGPESEKIESVRKLLKQRIK